MLLKVDSVTKKFGGLNAVSEVSFELEEGTILGLIGPNGAGKTTLFNCINGTLPITEGTITFNGEQISGKKILPNNEIRHRTELPGHAAFWQHDYIAERHGGRIL